MMTSMTASPTPLTRPLRAATITLIALNVGVWLVQVLTGAAPLHPSSALLLRWGADMPALTLSGDGWRLVTSMFLHAGLAHLAMNMLTLAYTGQRTQDEFGTARMLLIYLAGGVLASCASTYWAGIHPLNPAAAHPFAVSVGASGAIMALFGALLAAALQGLPFQGEPAPARMLDKGLLQVVVLNVVMGFLVPGIDQAAHLGGLTGGFVIGTLLSIGWRHAGTAITLARLAAIALLLVACLSALFNAGNPVALQLLRSELRVAP
jgi:rhomboid protease GluP